MSIDDRLLSEVLAHEAASHDVPGYDPADIAHRAKARRRRHRALVGGSAVAVAAVVGALAFSAGRLGGDETARDVVPQGGLQRVPVQVDPSAPRVPWCGWRPSDHGSDVLHVGGAAFATPCTYWNPGHRYLWYHADRLVMSAPDGIFEFLDQRWVKRADTVHAGVRISVDGRFMAWFEDDALVIHDFDAGARVARAVVPDELSGPTTPASVEGVDALGRVYTLVEGGVVWVLDGGQWIRVSGLPREWTGNGPFPEFSYLTDDGFAVPVGDGSVEGRISADGEFVATRTVPLGQAVWNPDRSQVVELTPDGFAAHPARDLGTTVSLGVPVDPTDAPQVAWDAQWESESTVLLTWAVTVGPQGAVSPDAFGIHRCWVTSGECQPLPGSISLPSSMGAHPGG